MAALRHPSTDHHLHTTHITNQNPQPVVLLSKPYEGQFSGTQNRPDYAHIENNGTISLPSLLELQARVAIRYLEVHEMTVPY